MSSRAPALALTIAAAIAAACSTNVPVGFDSSTSDASREVAAGQDAVLDAVRAYLRGRGDSIEFEEREDGGVLRTGRYRIIVEPGEDGGTHLHLFVMRYVGSGHHQAAEEAVEGILAHLE